MTFAHPLWALGVLPVWLAVLARERSLAGSTLRRAGRVLLRSLVLGLLAAALAGPSLAWQERAVPRRVVLLDVSPGLSPAGRAAARTRLEAVAREAADPAARVLPFHDAPQPELELAAALAPEGPLAAPPPTAPAGPARVAPALLAARAGFRAREPGRLLLLIGPGADLAGLTELAQDLARASIALEVVVLPEQEPTPEGAARVLRLAAPSSEVRGAFEVRADVQAPAGTRARLLADGRLLAEQAVPAGAPDGAATVHFDGLELPPGRHLLALALVGEVPTAAPAAPGAAAPALGEPPTLDVALAEVQVEGRPQLVVVLEDARRDPLVGAAQAQGFEVSVVPSGALEARLADEAPGLHALVLDAASAVALPHAAKERVARLVEGGLGLLVTAGTTPEAWPALAGTPLGRLLPLEPLAPPPAPPAPPPPPPPPDPTPPPPVDPPKETPGPGLQAERQPEEALPISLLLVLDRSASMRGSPWAMALEAAERAARVLSPFDRVGVLTFGEDARVELAMGPVLSAGSVALHLPADATGRATNLVVALRSAADVMRKERSPIRHVILLTDGMHNPTGTHNEQALWSAVVRPLAELGVTLTVVGLGEGHDARTLSEIAHWAPRGHYRRADHPGQVPTVFVVDTQGVTKARSEKARSDQAREEQARARLPDPEARPAPEPATPPPPTPPTPPPAPPAPPTPPPPSPPPSTPSGPRLAPLRLVTPHPATKGLSAANLPQVEEPRRSGPRTGAAVLLARAPEATVLAARRYGVGRVLALAAPARDAGLLAWPDLGRLLGQSLRSLLAPEGVFQERLAPRLVATAEGDRLDLGGLGDLTSGGAGGTPGPLTLRWRGPDGAVRDLGRLEEAARDGLVALPDAPRASLAHVEVLAAGGAPLAALTYVAGKAQEPRGPAAARAEVERRLAQVAPPTAAAPRERTLDLLPWLVLLAVLLLPLDAWMHRQALGATPR